ncbi:hypothetical protein Rsub_10130 [Raphidocelis subcapitata]|uniref:Uncharacterized protein n=1 Tax=Raphidocelis subcapitata TaxID=307507 RepID=A0A2V0PC55_9CHLO|nr:hypothetical protein Rsub_10130 [Raphidocelis subcapitata]|eukprot:GBF97119.1 hypothetical protein Rsub_10130 [Raphidocelis subcapitata]
MLLTASQRAAPAAAQQLLAAALQRCGFAAKAAGSGKGSSGGGSGGDGGVVVRKDWGAVKLPEQVASAIPTTTLPGQAFVGDLRSTSGLGLGDGKTTHTSKWLTAGMKSPMDYIQEAEPIKVSGMVVASHGSDDPNLGCPVEYISLKGTSYEKPAVCKYTGNKFYSDDWKGGGHH